MGAFDFDIIQIGYGPVGQTFAALVGGQGARIGVYERYPSHYGLPRAAHIDHETMRILQSLGCAERVEAGSLRSNRYEWRNAAGQTLISFEWDADGISGWPSDYMIYQPDIEDALHDVVMSTPSVSVNMGWEAVAIRQFDDHAEVMVRDSANPASFRTVTARYLVAADGGSSFTRQALGLTWDDVGFSQPWLVIDFREKRPVSLPFENGQICDPARPMCLFRIGKTHRRFSFMVKPGEEQWAKRPETAWSLVSPWVGPGDVELIRQTTYIFESKLLAEWKVGRTFFIGDSAHAMPPFMGQGMCSGFRDATNLSWKMALVLSGRAEEGLLDSYCEERKPHVADLTRLSVEVGRISCTTDIEAARKRDEALLGGTRPPAQPFPGLVSGILMPEPTAAEAALVGMLGPQNLLYIEGRTARADDLLGPGWHLICSGDLSAVLNSSSHALLDVLGVKMIDIGADAVDPSGFYRGYFAEHGVSAILVRPDFYIYGAAETPERLNIAVEKLARQLGLTGVPGSLPHAAASA